MTWITRRRPTLVAHHFLQYVDRTRDSTVCTEYSSFYVVLMSLTVARYVSTVYVDVGTMASDTATLNFMFLGTDMTSNRHARNDELAKAYQMKLTLFGYRQWEMKVSQLECFNQNA